MAEGGPPEKDEEASDGDELDIYLFSNGQQYSPPRKYHLRAEELSYWAATLAFLGRSQYGAFYSSIQLYELDGRKVEGAKDIRDCAVYVAVVPPDPFISAGYDKYLVKATRSYERRFSKKANGGPSNQDPINNPAQSQNPTPVKGNKIDPQCEFIQKNNNVCKATPKYSGQKKSDTIMKPVANLVSQGFQRKINPPEVAVKRIQSLKKETTKYNFNPKTNNRTTAGIPVRSLNSDRNKCAVKAKSPAKTLSFDTSIQKGNDKNQKFANHKHCPNVILKNKLTCNQVSPSLKTSKLDNFKALKTDFTMVGGSIIGNTHKQSGNHLHVTINNEIKKSFDELSEPSLEKPLSSTDCRPFSSLLVDERLPTTDKSRDPCSNVIKTPWTDTQLGLLVHGVPIVNDETASAVEELIAPNSTVTNLVDNKTNISHNVRNLNENFQISAVLGSAKFTNSDSISTMSENKVADSKILTGDRDFTIIEIPTMLTENNTQKWSNTYSKQQENTFKDQNNAVNATNFDAYPKLTSREPQLIRNTGFDGTKPQSFDEDLNLKATDRISVLNKTNTSTEDDELQTNLDLISILNETRTSTEPHSFILKSEEKPAFDNKDRIILINKRNEIVNTDLNLKTYETDKSNEADLIIKIKLSTAKATSRSNYFNTFAVETGSSYKINRSLQSTSEKELNEINETIFHQVSEKTFHPISKVPLHVTQNKTSPFSEVMPNDTTDIVIKTEDLDPTKIHSFIFYIKKDYDYNTGHVEDIKSKIKSEIQGTISNIIKNKDLVHINIFRSSIDEPILKSTDDHGIQNKIQNLEDSAENYIINDQVSNDKELSKPVSDENSTDVAIKTRPHNFNTEETESDAGQFVGLVQNGDTINLKLSIQVRNADGKLKSTQTNANPKSNSASQLGNNKLHKTPNQLTGSKSLQSVVNQCPPHLCCQRERIEVNQCPCCNFKSVSDSQNLAANPLNPSLQGLYVLLPISTLRESVKPPNQTIDKEVQYTESLNNYCLVQIVDQEVRRSQLVMESSQTPPSLMESKTQQTTRHFQDQSVQTDWCDVLLEAKAESDGHYTFYLPPLSLLQEYELR